MAFFSTRSRLAKLGGALGVLVVGIQFVRPELTHPPVSADLQAPAAVKELLKKACYDCHSNETKLPWFDQIVPAYWLVVRDVRAGRKALNFSDFNRLPPGKQKGLLYESLNQARLVAMPPKPYRAVHPKSVFQPEDFAAIESYLNPPTPPKVATPEQVAAVVAQFSAWSSAPRAAARAAVKPAPNGLAFFAGYQDWKVVSTTERFDNHTLRVITANDVAVRAIASAQTHPWPDGSAFAKIAWDQVVNSDGSVLSGEFKQVEFMLKDHDKYAGTEGWGFGRWLGTSLTPYGKDADFAQECSGCHAPMRADDFVFTLPIARQLPAELPYQPLEWRVITSSSVYRPNRQLSTLYGNDIAVEGARAGSADVDGAVLALVVWAAQEDPHWYGARIPGSVESIEFVVIGPTSGSTPKRSYQWFFGSPLRLTPVPADRAALGGEAIAQQRASVMP